MGLPAPIPGKGPDGPFTQREIAWPQFPAGEARSEKTQPTRPAGAFSVMGKNTSHVSSLDVFEEGRDKRARAFFSPPAPLVFSRRRSWLDSFAVQKRLVDG